MKRMWMIVILAMIVMGACSRNVQTSAVPEEVITAFNQRYPDAVDVRWELNNGLYEAEFMVNGQEREAYYREDGSLMQVRK